MGELVPVDSSFPNGTLTIQIHPAYYSNVEISGQRNATTMVITPSFPVVLWRPLLISVRFF